MKRYKFDCEIGKYIESIINDSMIITCDEITEVTKTIPTKTIPKNIPFTFLLITIALLIAVSVYCYLIKYRVKQKHLLPYHYTSNKLKEINVNKIIQK